MLRWRQQLNAERRATGMMFAIDPGADAWLGGVASARSSGTMAARYGTTRDDVMALRVAAPAGAVIETGSRRRRTGA